MSEHSLGPFHSERSGGDAVTVDAGGETGHRALATERTDDALRRFEREQLAREYAEIEQASAALRLAQPELESWSRPVSPPALPKSRPLWLLIGVLWLSTAIVTAGAVVVIASLAG